MAKILINPTIMRHVKAVSQIKAFSFFFFVSLAFLYCPNYSYIASLKQKVVIQF